MEGEADLSGGSVPNKPLANQNDEKYGNGGCHASKVMVYQKQGFLFPDFLQVQKRGWRERVGNK